MGGKRIGGDEMMMKEGAGRALVLTEKRLHEELEKGNSEVLLVVAAALNPTMFGEKVDFLSPDNSTDQEDYAVIRIPETGNAYAIHFETVAKLALIICAKTGKRSEVLDSMQHASAPTSQSLKYSQ